MRLIKAFFAKALKNKTGLVFLEETHALSLVKCLYVSRCQRLRYQCVHLFWCSLATESERRIETTRFWPALFNIGRPTTMKSAPS